MGLKIISSNCVYHADIRGIKWSCYDANACYKEEEIGLRLIVK